VKSSHKFEGKRPFLTKLLWMYVKVYIVHKQRQFLLCAVSYIIRYSRMCTDFVNLTVKHCCVLHVDNC